MRSCVEVGEMNVNLDFMVLTFKYLGSKVEADLEYEREVAQKMNEVLR